MKYFLGLGSNLGKKGRNLRQALALLEKAGVCLLRSSSIYRTQPVGIPDQPWFYNHVVEVETMLSPLELLKLIKRIEQRMGRKASVQNAPRRIDIDILLAGNTVVRTKELVIPHPRLDKRNFVLVPLSEIAPDVVHPLLKTNIENLSKKSQDTSIVKKLD